MLSTALERNRLVVHTTSCAFVKRRLYRHDCESDEEFSQLQRVRGYLSGLARRRRTAKRDAEIVTRRGLGVKLLSLAISYGLSQARICQICRRKPWKPVYPQVPEVLSRLYRCLSEPFNTKEEHTSSTVEGQYGAPGRAEGRRWRIRHDPNLGYFCIPRICSDRESVDHLAIIV